MQPATTEDYHLESINTTTRPMKKSSRGAATGGIHKRTKSSVIKRYKTFFRNLIFIGISMCIAYKLLFSTSSKSNDQQQPLTLTDVKSHGSLVDSINSNKDLLGSVRNSDVYQVDPNAAWRKPIVFDPRYSLAATTLPPNHHRCSVMTYVKSEEERQSVNTMLQVWKRAWWAFGFEPIILTEDDCKIHPRYEEFNNSEDISDESKDRFRKIFAWTARGAGLFADYTVMPVNWYDDEETLGLFRSCNFGAPTKYEDFDYDLFHGDVEYVTKLIEALFKIEDDEDLIDDSFDDRSETSVIAQYTPEKLENMIDGEERSISQAADIANAHLHHAFFLKYPKGIAVVDPFSNDALTSPAYTFAERLSKCPKVEFAESCPPTKEYLDMADKIKENHLSAREAAFHICGNPCAVSPDDTEESLFGISKAAKVEVMNSLPPSNSGYLSIISLPHPVSALTMTLDKLDADAYSSRKNLLRDPALRALTSQQIPSNLVGVDDRLLLIKDAIYQLPSTSNITWMIWEQEFGQSQSQDELSEWDLGFEIDGHKKRPSTVQTKSWMHKLAENAIKRVNVADDKDKKAIEAWNTGDSEMWKFLTGWLDLRSTEFHKIVFETKNL